MTTHAKQIQSIAMLMEHRPPFLKRQPTLAIPVKFGEECLKSLRVEAALTRKRSERGSAQRSI